MELNTGSLIKSNKSRKIIGFVHYPHFLTNKDVQKQFYGKSTMYQGQGTTVDHKSLQRPEKTKKRNVAEDIVVFPGYSQKVLTSNWFYPIPSFPKDYDAYNPPGGNYFRSTYNRWGVSDDKTNMISETKVAQESFIKELGKPKVKRPRPLLNMATLESMDMEDILPKQSEMNEVKTVKYSDDYTTTMQSDYISHYPQEPKIVDRAQLYKPETKYRKLLTELLHPRRPGYNKFYDENIDYLNAKRVTEIAPPPWALHYTPLAELEAKKEEARKQELQNATQVDEACAKCT